MCLVVWCVLVMFGWCDRGICSGVGFASLGKLHLPDYVVRIPKLTLEAAHHIEQGVLPDVNGLTSVLASAHHGRKTVQEAAVAQPTPPQPPPAVECWDQSVIL